MNDLPRFHLPAVCTFGCLGAGWVLALPLYVMQFGWDFGAVGLSAIVTLFIGSLGIALSRLE